MAKKGLVYFLSLVDRAFRNILPEVDPTIDASFAKAFAASIGAAASSVNEGVDDALNQSFISTAYEPYLSMHAQQMGLSRLPARKAGGRVFANTAELTTVPIGTVFHKETIEYKSTSAANSALVDQVISFTNDSGSIVITFPTDIVFANGLKFKLRGMTNPALDGEYSAAVIDSRNISCFKEGQGSTVQTGQGLFLSTYAAITVEQTEGSAAGNILPGGILTTSFVGAPDQKAYADSVGLIRGTDLESDEAFRARILLYNRKVVGIATIPGIQSSALSIPGNTRVIIVRPKKGVSGGSYAKAGYLPQLGEVVIYVIRDNDPDIFPPETILQETKDKILKDKNWPGYMTDSNLMVVAPMPKEIDFEIAGLVPDTPTMRESIDLQLRQFFIDNASVSEGVRHIILLGFMLSIADSFTGETIKEFVLNNPSADMTANSGELLTIGDITYV